MKLFWRQVLLLIAVGAIAAGIYGCGSQQAAPQPPPGGAQTTVTATASTPLPIATERTKIAEPSETPAPLELQPSSGQVELGKPYPFLLYTHCGVDFAVNFDGSYWDLAADAGIARGEANPPPGIGNPEQEGTMTLVERDRARFDYEGGSIPFVRHKGPKVVPGVCD